MLDFFINVSRDVDDIFYSSTKRDPGGIGFIDDVGGNVDGLMSCTESLGFESSDEWRVDDRIESLNRIDEELCSRKASSVVCSRLLRGKDVKKEVKKFPPPLSSLSQDGRPTFFLRPLRGDGRLKLTEVKICRPEILRVSRHDGRLKLHLVRDEDEDEDIQEQIQEEEEEDEEEEEEEKEKEMQDDDEAEDIQDEIEENLTIQETEEEEVEEKEDELEKIDGWQFSAGSSGSDAFRRCHEQVSHHPHHSHHQHVWRQHCLTIR